MRPILIAAALTLSMIGAAQAQTPGASSHKFTGQKRATLAVVGFKAIAPAKALQSWVMHNPYQPQTTKLSFVD